MKKQRKAREWWVVIYTPPASKYTDLITYRTKKAAMDWHKKESVFKVREVLPKRKSK
jgi:hypothetical protein